MRISKFVLLSLLLSGCGYMVERGAINDGSSLSRAVGMTISGAAGALIGQEIGGNAESAIAGAAIGTVAGAIATQPRSSSSSTNYQSTPASSSSAAAASEDISQYICYYRGKSYSRGDSLNFLNDRSAAYSAPDELLIYGEKWSKLANTDKPLQACDCGSSGWGCV